MNIKVAVEAPVELWVNNEHLTTFLCSPYQLKDLSVGHLLSRMYISNIDHISKIYINNNKNKICVMSNQYNLNQSFTVPKVILSGVSSIKHFNENIYQIPKLKSKYFFSLPLIIKTANIMVNDAELNKETGGVHAAIISDKNMHNVFLREDIGRHSAVDKAIGAYAREKFDFNSSFICTTGRLSLDMILKAVCVGIPVVVSLKRPSNLAIELAEFYNITLIGNILSRPILFTGENIIKT